MNFFISKKFYLPIIYIILGIIIYFIISGLVSKTVKVNLDSTKDKRKNTIVSLIKSIIKYTIAILVVISILSIYGVDTTKIIASLGIMAVVIGLAFQDIVKDLLAGISIIFDNQYTIGDLVEINGFKGEVISLGLKTTKVKAYTGEVKILSNSSFSEVTNYNLKHSKLIVDLSVSYNTNIDKLEKILISIKEDALKIDNTRGNYELLGIEDFGSSAIIYRVSIDCAPMTQHTVKRAYLKLIKEAFDKNNIEIPFNQLEVHNK